MCGKWDSNYLQLSGMLASKCHGTWGYPFRSLAPWPANWPAKEPSNSQWIFLNKNRVLYWLDYPDNQRLSSIWPMHPATRKWFVRNRRALGRPSGPSNWAATRTHRAAVPAVSRAGFFRICSALFDRCLEKNTIYMFLIFSIKYNLNLTPI